MTKTFADREVLVFSQFADTVHYLESQLRRLGVHAMAGVTGDSQDPTQLAWRFSPVSNRRPLGDTPEQELRVLIATDVLSEGQNLQDCAIVVNYDLPWAIIKLIQRAGRVDRIGQNAEEILCHSFLPADGVERIITLRRRVRERLKENAEVVGADEPFFEDEADHQTILNLYHEQAGILDGDADGEVDLASHAYQIWKNAIDRDPPLEQTVSALPDVVFSSRARTRRPRSDPKACWYSRARRMATTRSRTLDATARASPSRSWKSSPQHNADRMSRRSRATSAITSSLPTGSGTSSPRKKRMGAQLGRPTSARFRTYTRLKAYAESIKGQLFDIPALHRAIDDIYRYPLRQSAVDALNRQLRSGIDDAALADMVIAFRDDDRLCITADDRAGDDRAESGEPRIICSLGLFRAGDGSD